MTNSRDKRIRIQTGGTSEISLLDKKIAGTVARINSRLGELTSELGDIRADLVALTDKMDELETRLEDLK